MILLSRRARPAICALSGHAHRIIDPTCDGNSAISFCLVTETCDDKDVLFKPQEMG